MLFRSTDSVGAIVGALVGARSGRNAIPQEWLEGICDQPRSSSLLVKIADKLCRQKAAMGALGQVRYFWPLLVIRNLIFLVTVLCHGFRRLFPPY